MAKNTISIGDHCVVQSSPPSLLSLDAMSLQGGHNSSKLVRIQKATTILPGEDLLLRAPASFDPDSYVMVEPNLQQTKPFFTPKIIQLEEGSFSISNKAKDPITLQKNCQVVCMYSTSAPELHDPSFLPDPPPIPLRPVKDIVNDISTSPPSTSSPSSLLWQRTKLSSRPTSQGTTTPLVLSMQISSLPLRLGPELRSSGPPTMEVIRICSSTKSADR